MSKKRKTKKEKIQAAQRHDFSNVLTLPKIQELTSSIVTKNSDEPRITYSTKNYSYVTFDVKRTLFITALLVALDIVFYLILKIKVINFPGITF